MKFSGWSSLVISVCSAALVAAAPAAAHVVVTPPFVAAGDRAILSLTGPNERDEPMTGFRVVVPGDFGIVAGRSAGDWRPNVQAGSVSWQGGSLAAGDEAAFFVELEAPTAPGPATLTAEQLYPGDAVVSWAVDLTVTPARDAPSQNLVWAVVTAIVGFLVLTIFAAWIWRRRAGPLQER